MNTVDSDIVDVAVGVIRNDKGQFLLAKRAVIPGRLYPGYWEFPGGKREPDESLEDALIRELNEETDIDAKDPTLWVTRLVVYPHITVRLHFYQVRHWSGEPKLIEHSEFRWLSPCEPFDEPILLANLPILKFLRLPDVCAITNANTFGIDPMLEMIENALKGGLKMVRVREYELPDKERFGFAKSVKTLCDKYNAIAVLNAACLEDLEVAELLGFTGVHFTSSLSERLDDCPPFDWVGASCHTLNDVKHAETLGFDYVHLSPVKATASHPDAVPLSWENFSTIAGHVGIPVVALGGLTPDDLQDAWKHGAHGIACLRSIWR